MKKNNNIIKIERDPLKLFKKWFSLAKLKEINDPNAMSLSTVSSNMQPSSRLVLMKHFDQNGFVFNTNIKSKKGSEIKKNAKVCLNFYWKSIRRQIRIEGRATLLNIYEADLYFSNRPTGSKIGAWASSQSKSLKSRSELINRVKKFEKKYANIIIPRPSYWSGYIVNPNLFEFWKDMPYRLHDRIQYKKIKGVWKTTRLYP